jgi:hypothetical protein
VPCSWRGKEEAAISGVIYLQKISLLVQIDPSSWMLIDPILFSDTLLENTGSIASAVAATWLETSLVL